MDLKIISLLFIKQVSQPSLLTKFSCPNCNVKFGVFLWCDFQILEYSCYLNLWTIRTKLSPNLGNVPCVFDFFLWNCFIILVKVDNCLPFVPNSCRIIIILCDKNFGTFFTISYNLIFRFQRDTIFRQFWIYIWTCLNNLIN